MLWLLIPVTVCNICAGYYALGDYLIEKWLTVVDRQASSRQLSEECPAGNRSAIWYQLKFIVHDC